MDFWVKTNLKLKLAVFSSESGVAKGTGQYL